MYLNSEEDEMFLRMALKNHPRMPRNKRFIMYEMMEKFPMGHWAKLCASDEYVKIPPNFKWPEEENKIAPEAAASKPKEERQTFHYARIETKYCVDDDLNFCEGLAKAYHRLLEDRGEKIFLRGNTFMSKMAKSVFEQNGNMFADACVKYAKDDYFKQCSETVDKFDFILEDKKVTKDLWLKLYDIFVLLTEEYLATKCDLPKVPALECKDNKDSADKLEIIIAKQDSVEKDIDTAALNPLMIGGMKSLSDSSDSIEIGDLFYEFLAENFPCKDSREDFNALMKQIYSEEACEKLDWLYDKLANNKLPRPEFTVDQMEEDYMLGDHDGEKVLVNQRLVLDAISGKKPADSFVLLIVMLLEYGHFLNYALHNEAGKELKESKSIGKDFAFYFMQYSKASLLETYYEYIDFTSSDSGDEKQQFTVKVSGLSKEKREIIFYNMGSLTVWEGEE